MNGAESLIRTLVDGGVEVCFANPGTSELHLVAALDRVNGMRCVPCLFEGGATGAADGYARMAEKPAATLLHLGPGLGNGLANLHNARRALSPIINVVGDHATYHLQYDAPLTSDIHAVAGNVSPWVRTTKNSTTLGTDGAEAIHASTSHPGKSATLIVPADAAWDEGGVVAAPLAPGVRSKVDDDNVSQSVKALQAGNALILVGNEAVRDGTLVFAAAIAKKTGARIAAIGRNPRFERGVGRVTIERLPNPAPQQSKQLSEITNLVLVGEVAPVAFFAHPGRPGRTTRDDCNIVTLAAPGCDIKNALQRVYDAVNADVNDVELQQPEEGTLGLGEITPDKLGMSLGVLLPENAIIADESITTGRSLFKYTSGSAPHDWLHLTGGAIGIGIPMATGAAVACPDRKVVNLQADGSGMYTLQALWTQAREQLDVLTVVWANRTYKILRDELSNVGLTDPGQKALGMLEIGRPDIDWVSLGRGMGVDGERVSDMEQFNKAFADAATRKGPYLIEVAM